MRLLKSTDLIRTHGLNEEEGSLLQELVVTHLAAWSAASFPPEHVDESESAKREEKVDQLIKEARPYPKVIEAFEDFLRTAAETSDEPGITS